ncbi:MAG: hypothetical protein IT572_03385 [Deltaproteobacteria bacterium]|nr:hypothetical protein [Deltaproteobacteria bacterium]
MRLYIVLMTGFFPSLLSAQTLFQNTNIACENEPVLCATDGCNFPDANTLSCRNVQRDGTFRGSDFNGDGFADCVAMRENSFDTQTPELLASVLINRGAAAVACTPGPGDQFNASLDYGLSGLGTSDNFSNVLSGDLDGGNSDFLGISVEGFSTTFAQAMNPGAGFGADGTTLTTLDAAGNVAGNNQQGFSTFFGARKAALFDCDGANGLDAVTVVTESSPGPLSFQLNVLRNNGSGLQNVLAADSFDANVAANFEDNAGLTVGDFNGDGNLDVAAFFDTRSDGTPVLQVATVCLNDGNCNLACPAAPSIDLFAAHPGQDPSPGSIEAGDFDGDGDVDLVLTESGLSATDPVPTPEPPGLQYYDNDGAGNFTVGDFVPLPLGTLLPRVLTTGCYNNDNVTDVAVTLEDAEFPANFVVVVTSAAGGALNPVTGLAGPSSQMKSIDTADFDNAGGDDIMVLADNSADDRAAFVFMNGLETISAIAGADQSGDPGSAIAVTGASCSIAPEIADPFADPARFAVQWTVTASPAGSAPVLNGADTLAPTFSGDLPGVYTLQLACRTRCTSVVLDAKNVTLAGPAPTPAPTPTAGPVPVLETQGGCLASLTPGGNREASAGWAAFGALIFGWFGFRRLRR